MIKTFIYTFFFLFSSYFVSGQSISKTIELVNGSDTTYWFSYHIESIPKLSLIHPNQDKDFFRVSSLKYFLELSKNMGKIVFYAHGIKNDYITHDSYVRTFPLDSMQIKKIYNLIDSLEINKIPSDKYIKEWVQGFDGIIYIIESKSNNLYSFKNYWTPSTQKKFRESELILSFTTIIDDIIEYSAKRKIVDREINFYSWSYHGSMVQRTRALTKKEYKKMKKAEAKHKKHQSY